MKTTAQATKEIRDALREQGITFFQVSVRGKATPTGSEVVCLIRDPGVEDATVAAIANPHACEEGGHKRLVFVQRDESRGVNPKGKSAADKAAGKAPATRPPRTAKRAAARQAAAAPTAPPEIDPKAKTQGGRGAGRCLYVGGVGVNLPSLVVNASRCMDLQRSSAILGGVLVRPDPDNDKGVVICATDGKQLVEYKLHEAKRRPARDVVICGAEIKKLAAWCRANKQRWQQRDEWSVQWGERSVVFTGPDGDACALRVVEGVYPPYQKALTSEDHEPGFGRVTSLAAEYLGQLPQLLLMADKAGGGITARAPYDDRRGVIFTRMNDGPTREADLYGATVLIMPLTNPNAAAPLRELPGQAKAKKPAKKPAAKKGGKKQAAA